MHFKNITIIGTSHIARESIQEVRDTLTAQRPDIVAVELDADRAYALLEGKEEAPDWRHRKAIGWKGYYFARMGHYAEKTLGKMVGVKPGSEMKEAMLIAKREGHTIAFIDQPIQKTLKRLSATLTWREKGRVIIDIIAGFFRSLVRKPEVEFDLRKVPKHHLIEKLMIKVRERYPTIYQVLVVERNEHMAKQLLRIHASHPDKRVVAIMGAGHVKDVVSLLEKKEKNSDIIYYQSSYAVS